MQHWRNFGITLALALGMAGCSQLQRLWPSQSARANLQFQVRPVQTGGLYEVTGQTDLPDRSQIRVAAIRYLNPTSRASQTLRAKPTYAILAYQTAIVNQGQWQAQLNLWKVAPDGQIKEDWQLQQAKLKLPLKPEPDVVFLVTLAPNHKVDQLQQVEQILHQQKKVLETGLIHQTAEGERYLQTTQVLAVALPTGQTTPPPETADEINGGWGRRYLIPPEAENPNNLEFPAHRRTDARPAIREFMR
jgi:hypothetical protein